MLRGDWLSFDASRVGALLLLDAEEPYTPLEAAKLQDDLGKHGLGLLVAADWYSPSLMAQLDYTDAHTKWPIAARPAARMCHRSMACSSPLASPLRNTRTLGAMNSGVASASTFHRVQRLLPRRQVQSSCRRPLSGFWMLAKRPTELGPARQGGANTSASLNFARPRRGRRQPPPRPTHRRRVDGSWLSPTRAVSTMSLPHRALASRQSPCWSAGAFERKEWRWPRSGVSAAGRHAAELRRPLRSSVPEAKLIAEGMSSVQSRAHQWRHESGRG